MFSALKRLVSNQNEGTANKVSPAESTLCKAPHGVLPMDQNLQRKFAKGIQYNMKIIIRGDRNVGKTCLFLRLQGDKFREDYVPSDEIQVASIHWNYKATDDVVKVEIWDVVDKGKKKKKPDGLKFDNKRINIPEEEQPALDAEFVDVYKGTNGVIMMLDMTKQWTFDYVQREILRVPSHIPILVLANHRDMGHHRVVTEDQVHTFIEGLERNEGSGQVRYSEASMRNGFGLKFLHKFFNLPFLHLQRETLLRQLETNCFEIQTTCEELDLHQDSEEQNYDRFLDYITNRRRQIADQLSQVTTTNGETNGGINSAPPRSMSMPANLVLNQSNLPPNHTELIKPSPSIIIGANNPLPAKFGANHRNSSNSNLNNLQSSVQSMLPSGISPNKVNNTVKSVDEFIPDDEQSHFKSFLEEPVEAENANMPYSKEDSDSETELGNTNPLVSNYQEELDPEDYDPNNQETTIDEYQNSRVSVEEINTSVPTISTAAVPLNVLNSDDLATLENMYISANGRTASISAPSCSSVNTNTATPTSADNSEIGSEAGSAPKKIHQKSHKKQKDKNKKKSKKKKRLKDDNEDYDDEIDEDSRKLELFLGKEPTNSSLDTKSYELL